MWMLLHGFTGSPASWEHVLGAANPSEPVLAPWLLGHGVDWKERVGASFEDEVERLAGLARNADPPRFLAGYSLGARVGLLLLARHPDLFRGAVLVGVRPGLLDETERRQRRIEDARRAAALRRDGLHAFLDSWEKQPLFDTQQDLPEETLSAQRAVREGHDPEGLARSLEVLGLSAMPSDDFDLGSSRVSFMVGAHDAKFRELAQALARSHRSARVTIVDGAGHNLLLEAPASVAAEMGWVERECSEGATS